MYIREVSPERDYPTLSKWWEARGIPAPDIIAQLPRGYIIEDGPIQIAAAFLYLDVDGVWAMTEWLTTNPAMAHSRSLRATVKALLAHMEKISMDRGCKTIISMVAPNTGEERLLKEIGYMTSEGPYHKMYAKPLIREAVCPM